MFNATDFSYDGVYSTQYGVKIASFDSDTVENTTVFTPTLNTVKSSKSNKFFYAGVTYDAPPTFTFSIISETPIEPERRREILTWLVGRKQFKKLVIFQKDLWTYSYNCIFNEAEIIYVNGLCTGFTVTATFDSPYQHTSVSVALTGSGTLATYTQILDTDLIDEYTYPIVKFTSTATFDTDSKNVLIYNNTDDASRQFYFTGLNTNVEYTVDNELKTITGEGGSNLLDNFSLKWLRLRRGINEIKYQINGTIELTIPIYVKLGF